jgi:hypothetical protein
MTIIKNPDQHFIETEAALRPEGKARPEIGSTARALHRGPGHLQPKAPWDLLSALQGHDAQDSATRRSAGPPT